MGDLGVKKLTGLPKAWLGFACRQFSQATLIPTTDAGVVCS